MIQALVTGLTLGLGSGAAPGPLTGMAVTTTMRSGRSAGIRIAFAPLISDTLIIILVLTVVSNIPERGIQILGLAGAAVVAFFGCETLWTARKAEPPQSGEDKAPHWLDRFPILFQGAVVNVLNPAPWIFWITAGSSLLIGYWQSNPLSAVTFLLVFYTTLVGMKLMIVFGLAATRHRMNRSIYRGILYASGALLLVAAILLLVTNLP